MHATEPLKVIESVDVEPGGRLRLSFGDGRRGTIPVERLTRCGGVLSALNDPEFVKQVVIGPGGRCLEWPNEIDLCADALWNAVDEAECDGATEGASKRESTTHAHKPTRAS